LKKDRIGGFVNPSVEKIIALKPDLVFATVDGNRKETVAQIEKIGLPVFVVNPVTMEGFFKTISRIGKITGHTRESRDLIAQLRKKQQHIQSLTDPLPKTKVFFQVGVDPIITVGNDTFIDELIGLAGGLNIYGGETQRYPRCSIEDVLMKDPAVIILATMGGKNTFERANQYWRQWKQVQAVRKGRIHWIDPDTIDRFSPRIMDALEALTILLHPDLQGRLKRKGH
jgi:iron complex transport system substrate-binding protein